MEAGLCKPQASGLVWTASSWVSGLWQKLPAVPGAGECTEVKGVRQRVRQCFLPLSLETIPRACKRHSRYQSPKAARVPAHDGTGVTAAPKPRAQAARGEATVTRESRSIGARSPFCLVQIAATSGHPGELEDEKAEQRGILSSVERAMKSESPPSSYPFPSEDEASLPEEGAAEIQGRLGLQLGGPARW